MSGCFATLELSPDERKNIDAVTGATPLNDKLSIKFKLKPDKDFILFFEVNVSADFNEYFPYWSPQGIPDMEGNGQPSIVYSGRINSNGTIDTTYKLVGRTAQRSSEGKLLKDLDKISSAKKLIKEINIRYKK